MSIIDITGFTEEEVAKMRLIRDTIQEELQRHLDLSDPESVNVNFLIDPSIITTPFNHTIARVYTKRFISMADFERDHVCELVYLAMEKHGGHFYSEACAPGYSSMCGRRKSLFP